MPPTQGFGGPTLVALLATQQEFCAVEDQSSFVQRDRIGVIADITRWIDGRLSS